MRTWIPLAALFLAGWFGGTALAQPAKTARTVQDDLGLFSADAKTKANAEIARIKQTHKKDLFIETAFPPKQPEKLDINDAAAVNKFIDEWAQTKFKNDQINGVYVLFVEKNKLKKLRVLVGPKTLEAGLFTNTNRDELVQKITEKMKANDKDGALLTATSYVADTMQHNARPAVNEAPTGRGAPPQAGGEARPQQQPVQPSPIFHWILIGLGILIVFWIISAIIRGFSSMGGGGGYGGGYGPGYGGGGGGFMTGFLGGMFGAAAGMWMYSHFFGGGTPSAWAGGGNGGYAGGNASAPEPTDVGAGDPSVGGGDYGNEDKFGNDAGGGGGDWGGGGGGDAGGGGDWGGGGGGDAGGGGDWGGGGGGGGDFGGGGGGGGDW